MQKMQNAPGLIPGSGRSPGGGHGSPLQYCCLENPTDRGAWQATDHGVAKSQTWLSNWACVHRTQHWVLANFSYSCKYKRTSMMALNWLFSTSDGQPYSPHLQGSHLLCKLLESSFHCMSLAVPGPNALLMLQVVSTALWPIFNSNKKIAWICFLSNIISIA